MNIPYLWFKLIVLSLDNLSLILTIGISEALYTEQNKFVLYALLNFLKFYSVQSESLVKLIHIFYVIVSYSSSTFRVLFVMRQVLRCSHVLFFIEQRSKASGVSLRLLPIQSCFNLTMSNSDEGRNSKLQLLF